MSDPISEAGRVHLRWALTDGVGPLTFARIVELFGSAADALGASAMQLERVPRIGRASADRIAQARDTADVDAEVAAAAAHGVRILCLADDEYPAALRRIPDPPIVLYMRGELQETDAVAIAIVGTRRCSIYGSEQARRFGELLAGVGFTVVSGLARGIDSFAHHGAVDAGGRSIAVLGSGLREVYPPENAALAERLVTAGACVSELPMTADVRRENFPSRNRIIAGLTLGTIVVEAPRRSGALITARVAGEYNREVFAVPGRVQEPTCQGSNELIRDGAAKLITCIDDVLSELGDVGSTIDTVTRAASGRSAGGGGTAEATRTAPLPQLTLVESQVLSALDDGAVLADAIGERTHLPVGDVLAAITSLELKRLVRRLPGQMVQRVRPSGD